MTASKLWLCLSVRLRDLTGWSGAVKHPGVTEETVHIRCGEVELCHELVGDPSGPVMVLVNGLGGQLVDWDEGLLAAFRDAGLATLRFDNRDAGLSSGGDERFGFDPEAVGQRDRSAIAYGLEDLADDVVELLDALGIAQAHILGVSMGGMIAQLVAIRHERRVLSLCSVMSTTGAPDVGKPTAEALQVLLRPAPTGRAEYIERQVANQRVLGSPGFPADVDRVRARAAARYDRAFRPDGAARQLMAILLAGDRTGPLGGVCTPTLVVHGSSDPLIGLSGGQATADAIPAARLLVVAGMGHEIPPAVVPELVDAVVSMACSADPRVGGKASGAPAPLDAGATVPGDAGGTVLGGGGLDEGER